MTGPFEALGNTAEPIAWLRSVPNGEIQRVVRILPVTKEFLVAVSLDTVERVIQRTLGVLDQLVTSKHELHERAGATRTMLRRYSEGGRLSHPQSEWLLCEVCAALTEAAYLLKCSGHARLSDQIVNLLLADALYAIAKESHHLGFVHRTRAEELRDLSDAIRGTASRVAILGGMDFGNCDSQAVLQSKLRERIVGTRNNVVALQNLVVADPDCDVSRFGPVFDRATKWMNGMLPTTNHEPVTA